MVNVSHNNNDGVTGLKIFFRIDRIVDNSLLDCNDNLFFNLCAELCCNNFSRIVIDNLVDRCHHTECEQLFDNLCRRHFKQSSKLADCDFLGNCNFNLLFGSFGSDSLESFSLALVLVASHTLLAILFRLLIEFLLSYNIV